MELTEQQIDAIKRLDKVLSMKDGSADECHEYYCPYNIDVLVDHVGKQTIISEEEHGIYHGRSDGFDSECPRFIAINRKTGKWDCLCALEVIARLLGVDHKELYKKLKSYFKDDHEILGYDPMWRKE